MELTRKLKDDLYLSLSSVANGCTYYIKIAIKSDNHYCDLGFYKIRTFANNSSEDHILELIANKLSIDSRIVECNVAFAPGMNKFIEYVGKPLEQITIPKGVQHHLNELKRQVQYSMLNAFIAERMNSNVFYTDPQNCRHYLIYDKDGKEIFNSVNPFCE